MNGALYHKVIVVIGGTSGLGLSASKAFVAQGARLVIVGRDREEVEQAEKALGDSARALHADATDPRTAQQAVALAVNSFGKLDGLYHVAGGSGRRMGDGPLHDCTDEGWDYTLKLNLSSVFYSNRAAVRQFLSQGAGGTILNMGSVLGFSPAPTHFATLAYATAKSAIIGMTTASAAYYAKSKIRFNVIAPALMETPMSKRAATDAMVMKYVKTKQPLDGGRIGHATDCDSAAVYFLSDGAKFVTGQVLAVDGGWSVTEGQHA